MFLNIHMMEIFDHSIHFCKFLKEVYMFERISLVFRFLHDGY